MPLPLPRDQAERLVPVGLAQARDGDQPPGVSHLLHKVLSGCGKHFSVKAGEHRNKQGSWCLSSLSEELQELAFTLVLNNAGGG